MPEKQVRVSGLEENQMSAANPKNAFTSTDAERRWGERVDAAKRAVAEAEQRLAQASTPAFQTYAFQDLEEKHRALRVALLMK